MQSVDPRWSKSIALTALIIVSVFGWLAMEIREEFCRVAETSF